MRRHFAVPVVSALLAASVAAARPLDFAAFDLTQAAARPDDAEIVHLLNRIGFGPAPGVVDEVRTIGLQRYVDRQLHPERIDDGELDARLSGFTTLSMSTRELLRRFPRPTARPPGEVNRPAMSAVERQSANVPLLELTQQKLLRAVHSERQLEQVLVDFWFNHFNVDARKGPVRFMAGAYERDVIRPHVLGRFRDLLGATAHSPAMLFYLDNWMSAAPQAAVSGRARGRGGLNENYARELMELHTLGVDGGFTQKDVTEVARAFTGWTIQNPRGVGDFRFQPRLHDNGPKVVLGHRITAGGVNDGEQVLDILAKHPSAARHISTKLSRRFVSDAPPASLVDRLASRFTETDGDLREVVRTLLTSREFLSRDAYSAKVKTPFEFVVSSIRAVGADVPDAGPLVRALQQLGMPLYQCQPPTGYRDTADAWVNTGALVNRMNFAVTLASAHERRAPEGRLVAALDLLAGLPISDATRRTIAKASTASQAIALALGSPEFQRR